jgi:hypothetical protein
MNEVDIIHVEKIPIIPSMSYTIGKPDSTQYYFDGEFYSNYGDYIEAVKDKLREKYYHEPI